MQIIFEWVIIKIGIEITWGQIRVHHPDMGALWGIGNRGTGEQGSSVMRASDIRAQRHCMLETASKSQVRIQWATGQWTQIFN